MKSKWSEGEELNVVIKNSKSSFSMAEIKTSSKIEGTGNKGRKFSTLLVKRRLKLEILQLSY